MRIQLRELLRRLCVEIGWSYAVFWRPIRRCDQMELVWEDGYCKGAPVMSGFEAMDLLLKEKAALRSSRGGDPFAELGYWGDDMVGSLMYKVMANQVHVVGDGIVGQSALTGHHRWIHPDNCGDYGSTHKGLVETSDQFLAGIQTIAMIPVLPHGVVQLGSAQMVMENRGFINHVRNLFAQLGCEPCDFRSDVSQRPSSQNVHLSSPLAMPTSLNQSGSSDTYISRFSSLDSDRCNHEPLKASDSVTVSQPCSSFTDLHGKLPANAIEVSLTTNSSTMAPPIQLSKQKIHSVSDPILHQLSQLENGHVGAEVLFLHPDVKSMENAMLQESSSGNQHQSQILTSTLSSNGRMLLEEQLLSISGSRVSDDDRPNLDNSKNPQLQPAGCNFSLSTKKSDNILSFDHYISPNNINDLGKHGSFSSDTTSSFRGWCPVPSSLGGHQLLDCAGHSNNSQMLSRDSNLKHRESYALPFKDHRKSVDKLHGTLGAAASNEFDEQYSCYRPQLGTQGALLSCLNPDYESKGRKSFVSVENNACIEPGTKNIDARDDYESLRALNNKSSHIPPWCTSGDDLFDLLGLDSKSGIFDDSLGNILLPGNEANANEMSEIFSTCITQQGAEPAYDAENDEIHTGLFSESSPDQLLDAVVAQINSDMKQKADDNVSCKTSLTRISNSFNTSHVPCGWIASSEQTHGECLELSPILVKSEAAGSSSLVSASSADKIGGCFQNDVGHNSGISLWVENGESLNYDSVSVSHSKRIEESGKLNRKRPRAGENPRPRPKDRQMIQDRLKELREIVPNGSKCSIDALLEKTIKHMLFLQSVTTHADKLKEVGDSKIMSKDGAVLLKDNFKRGATWAFEVGSQSMICPIIVEDLNPPRQMLVEMLCEERGLFLEIADLVKGLGLTILKGVMENRNDKIWARFAVEANRDVTRMEIFLSLVRLLEPNAGSGIVPQGVESVNMPHAFQPPIPATGLSDHLR